MHFLDYFSIVEHDLEILNPTSSEKLLLLADYCHVHDGASVLDVGCGKGYLLRQWAKRWELEGMGLELNPSFVKQARQRATEESVSENITFIEGPALDFQPNPESYDVVTCIGAPFAIGSFDEAVAWMLKALKPNGVLAIGDEFLPTPLPENVKQKEGTNQYRQLHEIESSLEQQGLNITGFIAASPDDYDRYASGSWRTAHIWAGENPSHPNRSEVLRLISEGRRHYLRFNRHYLGWGIFVAQR